MRRLLGDIWFGLCNVWDWFLDEWPWVLIYTGLAVAFIVAWNA